MSLEDDMFNAFKYANFSGGVDPTKMIHEIFKNLEVTLLTRMQDQIRARLKEIGRAPPDISMDPFEILGVDVDATEEEVTRAYKEKARMYHPDCGGSTGDMVKLNAAYEAIRLFRGWKE